MTLARAAAYADQIFKLAEEVRTAGEGMSVVFVYDDLLRKNIAMRAEHRNASLVRPCKCCDGRTTVAWFMLSAHWWKACQSARLCVSCSVVVLASKVRRLLVLLGRGDANAFTPKALCAGRAILLTESGCSLGMILLAGEWSSAAFARYFRVDELSTSGFLSVILQAEADDD